MAILIPGVKRAGKPRPQVRGPQRTRKVAIIGSSQPGLDFAPWDDPTWEFWVHSSVVNKCPKDRADLLIDTHPPHCFKEGRKNGFEDYYDFLKRSRIPVLMDNVYPEIPASVRYPVEQIKQQWPYEFGSLVAKLTALAMLQGVTHLGYWGVEYRDMEYVDQRPNTVLWIGIAIGHGVQIVLPTCSTLLKNMQLDFPAEMAGKITTSPCGDYAFDTHKTVEQYEALKLRFRAARAHQFNAATLVDVTTDEEVAAARAKRLENKAWAKVVASFTVEDKMPPELIAMEDRQRADYDRDVAVRACEIRAGLAGAVRGDHAGPESVAGGTHPEGREGSGTVPRDEPVQSPPDPVPVGAVG